MKTKEELAAYQRQYRKTRAALGIPVRDSSSEEDNFKSRLRRYGLTIDTFATLFNKQGGKCAICDSILKQRNTATDRALNTHVDHCHTTGKVRGILCGGCNIGLGHFKDDPERLLKAANYLRT